MIGATTWKTVFWAGNEEPLSDKQAQLGSAVIVAGLALGYWLSYYAMPGRLSPDLQVYFARPIFYIGLGIIGLKLWWRLPDRPMAGRVLVGLALAAGAFNISALISAGVLLGFGHSAYARDFFHMAQNLWYLTASIFGLEVSRAYLLAVWGRSRELRAFAIVTVLIGGLWLAPGIYENLTAPTRSLPTFGRMFMPTAAESVMATFLVSIGGPLPAFIYHLSLEAFRWLSPILPRLEWGMAAFVGTLAPALAMLIVRDAYLATREQAPGDATAEKAKGGVSPGVLVAGSLLVALIWLNTGMLGVQPYLVSGPSMKPALVPGDLVFTKEARAETFEPGDIVKYRLGHLSVIHRVTEVRRTATGAVLMTKGDNNNAPDEPVMAAQLEGKVVFQIPYIGWVPIKLKNALDRLK